MSYKFYYDGGHGWLAIERDQLAELGILDQITAYSYQRGDTVYLEQDCDVATLAQALGGSLPDVQEINHGKYSPIHKYERFAL